MFSLSKINKVAIGVLFVVLCFSIPSLKVNAATASAVGDYNNGQAYINKLGLKADAKLSTSYYSSRGYLNSLGNLLPVLEKRGISLTMLVDAVDNRSSKTILTQNQINNLSKQGVSNIELEVMGHAFKTQAEFTTYLTERYDKYKGIYVPLEAEYSSRTGTKSDGSTSAAAAVRNPSEVAPPSSGAGTLGDIKEPTLGLECSFPWGFNLGNCILTGLAWITTIITWLFGLVTIVASIALDLVVHFTIIDFHNYLDPTKAQRLLKVWELSRDFCNLFFIFLLLYLGIGTMLRLDSVDWKKQIWPILISALLINFSLPLTKAAVDISNAVSNQFYRKIKPESTLVVPKDYAAFKAFQPDKTIAWPIIKKMNEAQFSENQTSNTGAGVTAPVDFTWNFFNIIVSGIYHIIVLLAISFVLFFGAVTVLIRGLLLLFLIIVSPFPFFFYHFKKTEKYYKMYKDSFIDQCLFLPTYMFMVYIALNVNNIVTAAGGTGLIQNMLAYALSVGFFALAVIFATDMGAAGADMAKDFAKKATGVGAGMAGSLSMGLGRGATSALAGVGTTASQAFQQGRAAYSTGGLTGALKGAAKGGLSGLKASAGAVGKELGRGASDARKTLAAATGPGPSSLGEAAEMARDGLVSKVNSGFKAISGTDLLTTSDERKKAESASLAARAAAKDKPKEEAKQKATDLKNEAKLQGIDKDPAKIAKQFEALSGGEQKEYYKTLGSEIKKKLEPILDPEIKKNLGKERAATIKGNQAEQSKLLHTLEGDDQEEYYGSLTSRERAALEDEAQTAGDQAKKDTLKALGTNLGREEMDKIENAREEGKRIAKKVAKRDLSRKYRAALEANRDYEETDDTGAPTGVRKNIETMVRDLGPEIYLVDKETLKKNYVCAFLTASQVNTIHDNVDLADAEKIAMFNQFSADTKLRVRNNPKLSPYWVP